MNLTDTRIHISYPSLGNVSGGAALAEWNEVAGSLRFFFSFEEGARHGGCVREMSVVWMCTQNVKKKKSTRLWKACLYTNANLNRKMQEYPRPSKTSTSSPTRWICVCWSGSRQLHNCDMNFVTNYKNFYQWEKHGRSTQINSMLLFLGGKSQDLNERGIKREWERKRNEDPTLTLIAAHATYIVWEKKPQS